VSEPSDAPRPEWAAPPAPQQGAGSRPVPPGDTSPWYPPPQPVDDVRQPLPPPPPPSYPPQGWAPYAQPHPAYQPYGYPPQVVTTNGMAIASLICGVVSIPGTMICLIPGIAAIPGLVLGLLGLRRISESRGRQQGRALAIGGIVTSVIGLVLVIAFIVLFGVSLSLDDSEF
jgi:Domain of unknown function (DUF4190)